MPVQFPKISQFKTLDAFAEYLQTHGINIPLKQGCVTQAQETTLFGRKLASRWAALPMEGWDCGLDGVPSELTLRRWYRIAQGGASLLAGVEAAAVMKGRPVTISTSWPSPTHLFSVAEAYL